jgi:hypothetical protein
MPSKGSIARVCETCSADFFTTPGCFARGFARFCSRACRKADTAKRGVDRFWSKVDRSGGPDACWPWTGEVGHHGYGRFSLGTQAYRAHRMAWHLTTGQTLTPDVIIRHVVCDKPICCNPSHLAPGSQQDNVADRVLKQRSARGERQGSAVLTESAVRSIRTDLATKQYRYQQLAEKYQISVYQIQRVATGKAWRHV